MSLTLFLNTTRKCLLLQCESIGFNHYVYFSYLPSALYLDVCDYFKLSYTPL